MPNRLGDIQDIDKKIFDIYIDISNEIIPSVNLFYNDILFQNTSEDFNFKL